MSSLFNLLLAVFSGFWLFFAGRFLARELELADRLKWIAAVLSLLILIGATGFFATILSGIGVLKLPASWEWPAGPYVVLLLRLTADTLSRSYRQDGYSSMTPNGTSYEDGMSMPSGATLKLSTPQTG
jgi:hypothetical protein